ncbi:hypothetical protein ACQKGC_08315 [Allorhizobium pseudoryzae]|uniref:hypothetical protein n=1 Tax=Allorhizobium pseudoryzae TaxID=379684 RepID=UPI003D08B232
MLLINPGPTLADTLNASVDRQALARRMAVSIPEIPGASIAFSLDQLTGMRLRLGGGWLHILFKALDDRDPAIIRELIEMGAHGVEGATIMDAFSLERLAELVAAAIVRRLK